MVEWFAVKSSTPDTPKVLGSAPLQGQFGVLLSVTRVLRQAVPLGPYHQMVQLVGYCPCSGIYIYLPEALAYWLDSFCNTALTLSWGVFHALW